MEEKKTIAIYGTHTCSDCKRAKAFLESRHIPFAAFYIEDDDRALAYSLSINGGLMTTPTIEFPDKSILVEPDNEMLERKLKELHLL